MPLVAFSIPFKVQILPFNLLPLNKVIPVAKDCAQ